MNAWQPWVGDGVQRGLAVRCAGRTVTYAELTELSARAAGLLKRRGVGRGDRVLFVCGDTLETLAMVLGALRLGAISILANPLSPKSDLDELVTLSRPSLLVPTTALDELPASEPENEVVPT